MNRDISKEIISNKNETTKFGNFELRSACNGRWISIYTFLGTPKES